MVGDAFGPTGAALGFELVHQFDHVEESAAGAVADAGASDRNGKVGLAGPGAADQNDVALVGVELATGKVAHQDLVDRRAIEAEVRKILGGRQLGRGDLVLDRSRLLLADLGSELVPHEALQLLQALDIGGDNLVEIGIHAVELELAHDGQDLVTLHHTALLRWS